MRLFKSTLFKFILATVLLLSLIVITGNTTWGSNVFGTPAKIIMSPFQSATAWIGNKISGLTQYFGDVAELNQENVKLREEVVDLKIQLGDIEELKEQNKNLRAAVKLKSNLDKFDPIGGNIIAKEAGNWFNTFTIDVGAKDGVKVDDPVVAGFGTSNYGLVGRVASVSPGTSIVVSIIDPYSKISAFNVRTKQLVVSVRGDINLARKHKCRLEFVDEDIEVGDLLETSGISGIYPRGLSIGTISEIYQAGNELEAYAVVEPVVDFSKLREVFLLIQKKK